MISKKEIKELEYENINGVFELILDSIIGKEEETARNLVSKMSQRQRSWFHIYLEDCPFHQDYINEAKSLML